MVLVEDIQDVVSWASISISMLLVLPCIEWPIRSACRPGLLPNSRFNLVPPNAYLTKLDHLVIMSSLPDHVWYLVLSLFEDDIPVERWQSSEPARPHRVNVEALLSLCPVSRRIRDLAQPMLYRTFHLASSSHGQYA